MVYLCGRPLPQPRPLHARPRDRDPADGVGRGRLAAHGGRRRASRSSRSPAPDAAARTPFPPPPAREDFDGPQLPIDFQWLRSPWPEELFSLTARPGHLRLYGRETIGSLFRQALVARRQQAHCFSAATVVEFEPRALPADGRPGLLLQQHQVPLPLRLARRDAGQAPARHVGAPRLSRRPTPSRRRSRFPPARPSSCASRWITSGSTSPTAWAAGTGTGCRSSSTPASSPTKPAAPGPPNFTGAFVGMACQDLAGTALPGGLRLVRVPRARVRRRPAGLTAGDLSRCAAIRRDRPARRGARAGTPASAADRRASARPWPRTSGRPRAATP